MSQTAGYYRLLDSLKDEESTESMYRPGALWYFVGIDEDGVLLVHEDKKIWLDLEEFEEKFEFEPDGLQIRQVRIVDLMADIQAIGREEDLLLANSRVVPCLPGPEELAHNQTSTELTLASGKTPAETAYDLKLVKTNLAKTKSLLANKNKELQRLIEEQSLIMQEKAGILAKFIGKAEEAIYMINAYLGKDEELVKIQDGDPAPATEKVCIRQLILYMDEESAAANNWAERGGMDFRNVQEFDAWLKNPKHLKQVLPESKGIVAIKPRRKGKEYSDNPIVNFELNKANKQMYLLIRNGDILYRIYTSLSLDDVLFPRHDEFEEFFYERSWDRKEKIPLQPGSGRYMDAMEKAEKEHRRFYTVLLLIQGLLDRTKIFDPLPANERVNICDLDQSTKFFRLIMDAERLLGDGRLDFCHWLREINSQIQIGCRVIGNWSGYSSYHCRSDEHRITPRYVPGPGCEEIYTLEKEDRNRVLFFYFQRTDQIYSRYAGCTEPKKRARFEVRANDDFYIHFDAATMEDMEYYCNSRTNRHRYQEMLPLLHTAIKMKKKEKKQESPFRKLLIGEIVKQYKTSFSEAEDRIDVLIDWWKFKTKTHRALTSDDRKALRMIVTEFGRRFELEKQQSALAATQTGLVQHFKDNNPNLLAVFHRRDNEYTVLSWHNEFNIFVQEEIFRFLFGGSLFQVDKRPWRTVDKRHESWALIFAHERWAKWEIGASANDYLTDPELEQISDQMLAKLRNPKEAKNLLPCKYSGWGFSDDDEENKKIPKIAWLEPFAVCARDDKKEVAVFYLQTHVVIPNSLHAREKEPEIGKFTVEWERKQKEIKWVREHANTVCLSLKWKPEDMLRDESCYQNAHPYGRVLRYFAGVLDKADEENKQLKAYLKQRRKRLQPAACIDRQLDNIFKENWKEERRQRFNEEYVDDDGELWEERWEKIKDHRPRYSKICLETPLTYLIEANISLDGLTVREVLEKAKSLGFKPREDDDDENPYHELLDVVVDPEFGKQEDEDDDDEE